MDIQKYKFYVGLGIALLIYVGIYTVMVRPYSKKIRIKFNSLRNKKNDINNYLNMKASLANDQMIEYHNQQKELLQGNIKKSYAFFNERDLFIERWFPKIEDDLKNSGRKLPELYVFQPAYNKQKQKLIEKYSAGGSGKMKITRKAWSSEKKEDFIPGPGGFGVQSETNEVEEILPLASAKDVVTNPQMKKVQKQFWLIEKFLEILEEGKMRTLSSYKFSNDSWQETPEKNTFIKRSLSLTGTVDYENIPLLLQQILSNKYFMTEITAVNVDRIGNYKPIPIEVFVPWGKNKEQALQEFKKKNPTQGRLPAVTIALQCDVLDYEGE